MTAFTPLSASIGGALIGLAAVVLMGSLGRIAGISGIVGGLTDKKEAPNAPNESPGDKGWRLAFLAGLITIPAVIGLAQPDLLRSTVSLPLIGMAFAGLIVGIGVTLGNGCTSGHGVCGNARLSIRSLVATLTFMAVGVATTYVVRHIWGIGL